MELIKFSTLNAKKQQGVVLIVALVFLIALTAVAAALMANTTTDMKMSGASQERTVAIQEAMSAVDELIFRQVNANINAFASPIVRFDYADFVNFKNTLTVTNNNGKITAAEVSVANNTLELEPDCPHSRSASSSQVFTCNMLQIQVRRKYGRTDASTVEINSGIAQQLLRQ